MLKVTDTEKLGALIRDTRKAQGLTQEQLAGICGVGVRFIRELEHGKESCHIGKAMTVLQMLGLQLHIEGGRA
jgi:y4mF family transcriptional regulator